jgi:alpha-tubulin suppressor-like RCC1 family protein
VKCWGRNSDGQLGIGDLANRGTLAGDMGQALPKVELGSGRTAKSIFTGAYHSCAILDDDTVKCWGDNGMGQLGYGDYNDRGDSLGNMGSFLLPVDLDMKGGLIASQLSLGRDHTCALLNSNQINCWGDNASYQLGGGVSRPSPQDYPVDLGVEP